MEAIHVFILFDIACCSETGDPTESPTAFPTEEPAEISFIEVVCSKNETYQYVQHRMNLTEDDGFSDNVYGENGSDGWLITNISLPVNINDSSSCQIHIYLSNNDYWGYRENATCFLNYLVDLNDDDEENNQVLEFIQLDMYNILDVNKRYNTFWNLQFLSNTTFNFGSYPICNAIDNQINEVPFANLVVEHMIDDIEYDTSTHDNDGGGEI